MRLIDADALIESIKNTADLGGWIGEALYQIKQVAIKYIDSSPSIDIVRCKECKHNYNTAINHGKMQPRCDFADWKLTENDFCSRGEREDE